jgi:hypothetical protein
VANQLKGIGMNRAFSGDEFLNQAFFRLRRQSEATTALFRTRRSPEEENPALLSNFSPI